MCCWSLASGCSVFRVEIARVLQPRSSREEFIFHSVFVLCSITIVAHDRRYASFWFFTLILWKSLLIELVNNFPRSLDNIHSSRRIRMTAHRDFMITNWQLNRFSCHSCYRRSLHLLTNVLLRFLWCPGSTKLLVIIMMGKVEYILLLPINN